MRKILFPFAIGLLLVASTRAQETIHLYNASFEGIAQCCQPPFAWQDCGFVNETPPDVHPSGAFEVDMKPYDGKTYLGMAARSNDTWERVGQKLGSPILADVCYKFSIYPVSYTHLTLPTIYSV